MKVVGSLLLIVAGYLMHILFTSQWLWQGKMIVAVLVLMLIYMGLVCVFYTNNKTFKENISHSFEWINYPVP